MIHPFKKKREREPSELYRVCETKRRRTCKANVGEGRFNSDAAVRRLADRRYINTGLLLMRTAAMMNITCIIQSAIEKKEIARSKDI